MLLRALVFVALAGLSACVTPCPPAAAPPAPVTKTFRCATNETLTVTFSGDTAVVQETAMAPITLRQLVAGSGFRYAAGGAELRGRGDEVRYIRPGAGERLCRTQN
jgi:membrane-bound inhibitor of C-type lysozyme